MTWRWPRCWDDSSARMCTVYEEESIANILARVADDQWSGDFRAAIAEGLATWAHGMNIPSASLNTERLRDLQAAHPGNADIIGLLERKNRLFWEEDHRRTGFTRLGRTEA